MLRHITISGYGQFLGIKSERLTVQESGTLIAEYPLSRIKTLTVAKEGVSLSSNLILACSARGVKIFFLDFRGRPLACISHANQHAVCSVRESQFRFIRSSEARAVSAKIVHGKLRNQRAVLKYFSKSLRNSNLPILHANAELLEQYAVRAKTYSPLALDGWRNPLMGIEGQAARCYWEALKEAELLPSSFQGRVGRGGRRSWQY